ncbi:hypothetical protein [Ferruginibacter sp.]
MTLTISKGLVYQTFILNIYYASILICNNVAAIVYLCFVLKNNKIWIKKIAASFLLLLLFSITAIQLSHSHTYNTTVQEHKKDFVKKDAGGIYYKALSESKCFICEYQLTRDADISYSQSPLNYPALFNNSIPVPYCTILSAAHTVFENRGPPHTA